MTLLNRDFTAPAPNRRWVADFTYCRTWAGFVYVAFVVDVFAQRIIGWHAVTTKITDLVLTPGMPCHQILIGARPSDIRTLCCPLSGFLVANAAKSVSQASTW